MFTIPKSLKSMTKVAAKEPSRYAIDAIRVEPIASAPVGDPAGLAVATDGKRLLACRVEGDGVEDTSHAAMIGKADWAAVCRAVPRGATGAALSCNGSVVAKAGAATIACEAIENQRFPQWRRVIPGDADSDTYTPADGYRFVGKFSRALLAELLASMPEGPRENDVVVLYADLSGRKGSPMVMASSSAVGVVMPVSSDRSEAARDTGRSDASYMTEVVKAVIG